MTPRAPNKEITFNLTFGVEAIIAIEIKLLTTWVEYYNKQDNSDQLQINVFLLEEIRECARIRVAVHQ